MFVFTLCFNVSKLKTHLSIQNLINSSNNLLVFPNKQSVDELQTAAMMFCHFSSSFLMHRFTYFTYIQTHTHTHASVFSGDDSKNL